MKLNLLKSIILAGLFGSTAAKADYICYSITAGSSLRIYKLKNNDKNNAPSYKPQKAAIILKLNYENTLLTGEFFARDTPIAYEEHYNLNYTSGDTVKIKVWEAHYPVLPKCTTARCPPDHFKYKYKFNYRAKVSFQDTELVYNCSPFWK